MDTVGELVFQAQNGMAFMLSMSTHERFANSISKILSQSRLLALGSIGPRSPIGYRSHLRDRVFEHADIRHRS